MTLAIDSGNVVSDTNFISGTSTSTSVTMSGSDNLLLVMVGNRFNSGDGPPDTFTYNAISLTLLGFEKNGSGNYCTSLWYLPAGSLPSASTYTLAGTWTTITSGGLVCVTAVPMSGAATSSIFGTLATAESQLNNTPAISPTGGSAGTLYLSSTWNGQATTTSTGTGQSDVANVGTLGGGANNSYVVSSIAGSGTGVFTWSSSGNVDSTSWCALGVNINAGVVGPTPTLQSWQNQGAMGVIIAS